MHQSNILWSKIVSCISLCKDKSLSNVHPRPAWKGGEGAGPRKTGRIYQSAPSHIIVVQVPHALVCAWYIQSVWYTLSCGKGVTFLALGPAICKLELPLLINSALSSYSLPTSLSHPLPILSQSCLPFSDTFYLAVISGKNVFLQSKYLCHFFIAFSSSWEEEGSFHVFPLQTPTDRQ